MHFEFNPDTCRTWLELGEKKKKEINGFARK